MKGSGWNRLRPAVLLLLCGVLAFHALHFFAPVDDAFISFRYAENLAAGRGPVFNEGERVEGYTNFLWVVLLAALRRLGVAIPLASQVLGVLFSLAALLAAAAVARKILPAGCGAGIPAALFLAASPALAMWAGGGMEVPLFSFLALLASWAWMHESDRPGLPWRWPLAACLASLARPDGVLLFATALTWEVAAGKGAPGPRVRRSGAALGIFAAAGAPYFLWRWIYYGALLPNTYYAKVNYDPAVLGHGFYYLEWFLLDSGGAAIALGALLALRPRDRRVSLLLGQGSLFTLYVLLLGGDGYAYSRFLVPVAVLLAPAAEFGYRRAWRWLSGRLFPPLARVPAVAVLALAAMAAAEAAGSFAGADYQNYRMGVESESRRRAIGEWLRKNARPGSLLALNPVGMIPYVSGLPTLDLLGLTDVRIARKGERVTNRYLFAHNRFDPDYVLSRRPDTLILGQATLLDVDPRLEDLTRPGPATFDAIAPAVVRDFSGFPGDERIWKMPAFRRLYTPTIARIGEGYFYYFALDPEAAELEARLEGGSAGAPDHARMARILAAKGEIDLSLAEAARAEALDPALGSVRKGIEESAEESRRESGSRDRVLGALQRTERPEKAIQAYGRALEVRPDFADACNNLGSLYARRGDLQRARKYWERAVAIDPASAARENLRRLERQRNSISP